MYLKNSYVTIQTDTNCIPVQVQTWRWCVSFRMARTAVGAYSKLSQDPPLHLASPGHQSGPSLDCHHRHPYQAIDHRGTCGRDSKWAVFSAVFFYLQPAFTQRSLTHLTYLFSIICKMAIAPILLWTVQSEDASSLKLTTSLLLSFVKRHVFKIFFPK